MFPIALLLAAAVNLAPGIWVLRHADAPDGFPQGNTTLVLGEEARPDVFARAADAELALARPLRDNGFKVEMARRLITRTLEEACA